jgi:hypothetical protein
MQQFSQQRRSIDQRFDPRMAIEAQTRYLIWMWARYPSLDWVFEAYHGGEKGVERTLASYLGARWREAGTPAHAILGEDRMGNRVGDPVSYADIFFHTSPRMHTEAFAYLYGLRDDHRAYWFKLLMAEKAIAWYRRDPRSLHDQWMALRPGCPIEDAWYPETDKLLYADGQAVAAGRAAGELIPLSSESIPGVQVGSLPFLPETQSTLAAARPEVLGALSRVAVTYREESLHPSPLVIVALTQPVDLVAAIRQQYPAPRPRGMLEPSASDPSSDTDMHTLGLAASIRKPTDPWEDRVLQYALSYWEDRERIHFNTETWGGIEAWRITPNPVYKQELSASRKNGA